ncbi:MAG: LON peptidase substrate-binding domain-containing protein [Armatimonadetes bacterium]|nr:MAG: peptidase S16 [Armatimonadota bacterium]KXK15580.1 MAG: hypothetical protein UZ18_ATM001001545 [Armatimonadetes bacterium OLB18]MBV6491650.1 Lon protease 2 [Fimbriimonadaceae bacterium]QOJ12007.1 MAG: LON peptidase substrate-binding domain-containing protein [Chthonomonadaceae bacterium]MBL1151875.1 peptidase S16 [Armatimonadota bacterium]
MADQLEELPLLPLSTVLFPYGQVRLHIFEERHQSMVRDCFDYDRPFGIVMIRNGDESDENPEPYLVGTAVRIDNVHTFADGRLDLRVQGERRFRIRKLERTTPYWVGKVEPVVEEDPENVPRVFALASRAREDFVDFMKGVIGGADLNIQVSFPSDATALSFMIASYLPMEEMTKQRMLETTDTGERLAELLPILQDRVRSLDTAYLEIIESKPMVWRHHPSELKDWILPN